jgi:heme-degrading monooxygenase HmoA
MIQERAIFTVGQWIVKPDKEEIFLEKWREFAQWTIEHTKGGQWVYMVRDQEKKNKFISFAPWDSSESIK